MSKVIYTPIAGVDLVSFSERLKINGGICPCSLEVDNMDMKCICKPFKEAPIGSICHCEIFTKKEVEV